MKKIILIEDEIPARKKLKDFILRLDEKVEVVAELSSVQESLIYLSNSESVDLIFSDIQLLDGSSFEIFEKVQVNCPVIFTTAYDSYWMDAFEVNGIDYLLKPFGFDRFLKAWEKFIRITHSGKDGPKEYLDRFQDLLTSQSSQMQKPKSRIMVPSTSGIYFLEISEVSYFLAENGVVRAIDSKGKKHLLRQATLKEIEDIVDSNQFFRINRAQLVNKSFVEKLERYNKNTLAIFLRNSKENLVTSQSATSAFLEWLEE